jgi:hypothetical protein
MIKYAIGVTHAVSPQTRLHVFFWMTDTIASGLISGIFVGRFVHIIREYQRVT